MNILKTKERLGRAAFFSAAVVCVLAVAAIFGFLIYNSIPAFEEIGVFEFVFGDNWSPDRTDTFGEELSGSYGVLTMIVGTLCVSAGALICGGVLGYFTAVFLAFYCKKRLKRVLVTVINLLAGIPSVVYGFFGIVFLLPILSLIAPNNGSGLLATSLVLGIMILPTVVSLSKTSLEAVPRSYYEGSIAMGATHTQTVFKIMSPAARSGIFASLVLGIGRALGETMAVVMIAGNSPTYPSGLFSSFRVLTANIVMEMGYAGDVQAAALVASGVILLLFVLLLNLLFNHISHTLISRSLHKRTRQIKISDFRHALANKINTPRIFSGLSRASGIFVTVALALIIGFILARGLPPLLQNPYVVFGKYEFGGERITLLPAILSTLWAVLISLSLSVPIGVMSAIYLTEYTKKERLSVRIIRTSIDILAGVPSIVYGLFGMITFVSIFGGQASILSGSLTISMMLLPTIVRSTEESLRAVPNSLREGSLALGAGKLRTIFKIVLPSALSGIMSALILCIGRVIGESAPFLYTAGSVISAIPRTPLYSGATLSVALYQLAGEGWYISEAYAAAAVLIIFVLLLNLLAERCVRRLGRHLTGGKHGK